MKKRVFVSGIVILFMMVGVISLEAPAAQSASGERIRIEFSCTQAPGSTIDLAVKKFKSLVEEKSNGRISVILYLAGQLYNPRTEVEAIVKGALAMAPLHPAFIGARSPVLEFVGSLGAQGCWVDRHHYWRFTELPETRRIANNELKSKINAKLLGMLSGGSSIVCNRKRPIHTVEDFKNLKMRVAGSANALLFRSLEMVPVNMSAKEVYMALQRGTVDGAVTAVGRYYKSKWYEVAPYVTVENSVPDINSWLVINLGFWNKLSKTDRQLLTQASAEVVKWTRSYSLKEAEESYRKFKDGLVKDLFFFPNTEIGKIIKIARPAMHKFIIKRVGKEMGDQIWDLLLDAEKEK